MQNQFDYSRLLEAIEHDLDYHQYPSSFTLEQIRLGDKWLREAALAVLADAGFFSSSQGEPSIPCCESGNPFPFS
jgi:hypothetical protein